MDFIQKIISNSYQNIELISVSAMLLALAWLSLFQNKRYIFGGILLLWGVAATFLYSALILWLWGLGGDSFLEASNFNLNEALHWMNGLIFSLIYMIAPIKIVLLINIEAFLASIIIFKLLRRHAHARYFIFVVLLTAHGYILYLTYKGYGLEREYVNLLKKQFDKHPIGFSLTEDIDLFVYIGESTSTLNMSLYGYPLKTTPMLDKIAKDDQKLIKFDRIRSTHTHTSLSLLRALAIDGANGNRATKWGIGNVLKSAGAHASLYSVQPLNGSSAAFSKFVFDGMNIGIPAEDRYKGNGARPALKDHQLLKNALKQSGVVFFHSYAGHGDYLDLIDPNLSHKIARPDIAFPGMVGSLFLKGIQNSVLTNAADYDQAITYIDANVAEAILHIASRSKPAALIYFSDHGDSVYSKRGHDSSLYIDEMSRVPLLIYFNDAYKKKYTDVFNRYRDSADSDTTKILDQVTPTILDLLRIHTDQHIGVPDFGSNRQHPHPYIMERRTMEGSSRIDLNYDAKLGFSVSRFSGGTPDPTYIAIINEAFEKKNSICYHGSNSFSKALRGASVAGCLEVDLVVEGKTLSIHHPPAPATGFTLENIFDIAEARRTKLWIDAKNIQQPLACQTLLGYLRTSHHRTGQILVEFPFDSLMNAPALRPCIQGMHELKIRTSYYVPTHFLLPCVQNAQIHGEACRQLHEHVEQAVDSKLFSDLSFDFLGFSAMEKIKAAGKLKWNTWEIRAQDFPSFPHEKFDFIIMNTSADPNSY